MVYWQTYLTYSFHVTNTHRILKNERGFRTYQTLQFTQLVRLKVEFEEHVRRAQTRQESRRRRRQQMVEGPRRGRSATTHPPPAGNPANDTQREDDIFVPKEDRLESYAGKNEDTQVEHRRKYKEFKRTVVSIYHPKSDDLLGGKPTINEACEALGYRFTNKRMVKEFMLDLRRPAIIKRMSDQYRNWCRMGLHTDKLRGFVKSPSIMKNMDHWNSFFKNCLDAIKEWDEMATDHEKRDEEPNHIAGWKSGVIFFEGESYGKLLYDNIRQQAAQPNA